MQHIEVIELIFHILHDGKQYNEDKSLLRRKCIGENYIFHS